ncbi:glycerate kinase [Streptomyces oceani]|uniref:Glycerate kinase n=1 Tax=Streptomyces oceani TaxID=1075402 RepID=A0A1E7KJX8_9ACTN|nr:glycerate kinase [Streptomyces oceani]OEV04220.1 glycerate kinase [Streptomyces oceani]
MAHTGRVLIAADKFKGSLTAVEVAEHVTVGLGRARPDLEIRALPVADGGDGTVEAAVADGFERHEVEVTGPLGAPVTAAFALRDGTAVIEMAQASGLQLMPPKVFAPLTATTYGCGEVLRAALDAGARTILLGVGGSATTDGGTGMLQALGAQFLDEDGDPVPHGGGPLRELVSADLSGLDERLAQVDVILASDVDNPLTGPKGAAAVYGPQKGAGEEDIAVLDAGLTQLVQVLAESVGTSATEAAEAPGAGAAGGVGYGALVGLGATFRPGIEVLLEVVGFAEALKSADLVITGEGSLDAQTLHGKAPAGVADAARKAGKRVVAVCGRLGVDESALRGAGIARAYSLGSIESDTRKSMANAGPLLEQVAETLAEEQL